MNRHPNYFKLSRSFDVQCKAGATWIADIELDGIINYDVLARKFFDGQNADFIEKKISAGVSYQDEGTFSESEYHRLANAFLEIGNQLIKSANEIETAKYKEYFDIPADQIEAHQAEMDKIFKRNLNQPSG